MRQASQIQSGKADARSGLIRAFNHGLHPGSRLQGRNHGFKALPETGGVINSSAETFHQQNHVFQVHPVIPTGILTLKRRHPGKQQGGYQSEAKYFGESFQCFRPVGVVRF